MILCRQQKRERRKELAMPVGAGKPSAMGLRWQAIYAQTAYKPESHAPTCEPSSLLVMRIIEPDFQRRIKASRAPEGVCEALLTPCITINLFSSYVTGLEDKLEALEALLRQVRPFRIMDSTVELTWRVYKLRSVQARISQTNSALSLCATLGRTRAIPRFRIYRIQSNISHYPHGT